MKAGLYKDDLVRVIDVDYSSKRATIEARAVIFTCLEHRSSLLSG